jgi:hypothetical protein
MGCDPELHPGNRGRISSEIDDVIKGHCSKAFGPFIPASIGNSHIPSNQHGASIEGELHGLVGVSQDHPLYTETNEPIKHNNPARMITLLIVAESNAGPASTRVP